MPLVAAAMPPEERGMKAAVVALSRISFIFEFETSKLQICGKTLLLHLTCIQEDYIFPSKKQYHFFLLSSHKSYSQDRAGKKGRLFCLFVFIFVFFFLLVVRCVVKKIVTSS
jgi:hypothetical protein